MVKGSDVNDTLRQQGPDAVRGRHDRARKYNNGNGGGNGHSGGADLRPTIRIRGGKLADHVKEAEKTLGVHTRHAPFEGVFSRGSVLVRPVRLKEPRKMRGVQHVGGSLVLLPIENEYLRLQLTRLIRFQRFDKRVRDWVEIDAPESIAKGVRTSAPWNGLPPLTGIIEAPTIRCDGSLLDRPGYDDATGLLFDPGITNFPAIPRKPTRAQAATACDLLLEMLDGFPFVDYASQSVAISAVLTCLIRRSIRAAPLFGITAPKMSSGKTLLATVASYIATGRAPAMTSQAQDRESERKTLFSLLLEGAPILVIDNVERPLGSDVLCSILTEPFFVDRLLGASRTARVPTNATFFATGNNLQFQGDLVTRTLMIELDPQCERPEERSFTRNLHQEIPARRGELVAAALTIPLAYLASGEHVDLKPFGRFEQWCRWCREPFVWLGMADPCLSRTKAEAKDPVGIALRALLTTWHNAFRERPLTVADVQRSLYPDQFLTPELATLCEVMNDLGFVERGGAINTRRLGNFISSHEHRIEKGLQFERFGDRSGVTVWRVRQG